MKTVYSSNSELTHVWANNPDPTVFKKSGSMSCQFDKLYSYNTCIAELIGETVVFNSYSYSPTTSKHQSYARSSTHGVETISLDIPSYNLRSLVFTQNDFNELVVKSNQQQIAELLVKVESARIKSGYYKSQAIGIENNLRAYAKLLKLDYTPLNLDQFKADAIAENKARKAQAKIRKAEKVIEQAEDLIRWRNGEDVRSHFEITALRVKGDEIETTKGAKIPVDHAVRAFPLLKRLHKKDASIDLSSDSIKLGYYTVNRVERDNLIVGCHSIPFNEIYEIAKQLNLEKVTA
jgi:hypothetical protein